MSPKSAADAGRRTGSGPNSSMKREGASTGRCGRGGWGNRAVVRTRPPRGAERSVTDRPDPQDVDPLVVLDDLVGDDQWALNQDPLPGRARLADRRGVRAEELVDPVGSPGDRGLVRGVHPDH